MIILDSLLIGGIKFVLGKIAQAVETEMNDTDRLREELLAAQMRLELGEITEEEFAQFEHDVLARLRELKRAQEASGERQSPGAGYRVTGVEARAWDDEE